MNWKKRCEEDGTKKTDEKGGMNRLFHTAFFIVYCMT